MSSNQFPSPSPGTAILSLAEIMIRYKQGRTVYSAADVRGVCDHYISTASCGIDLPIDLLQFLRYACLPFGSNEALARLKALPHPVLRPTLDEHFNILLADDAPSRLQVELEAQPQSLFFVGDVVNVAALQSLASGSERKPAVRISRTFSQSALAVLFRCEDGTTLFPQQDIGTLCSYMRELNIREADVWVSLVAFLRDAACPFATTSLHCELTSQDQSKAAQQYNLLVLDGAVNRLMEAVGTSLNPDFLVKAGGLEDLMELANQIDGQLPGRRYTHASEQLNLGFHEMTGGLFDAAGHDEANEADDEAYDKENVDPKAKRPRSSKDASSITQKDNSNGIERVRLTGETGPTGNALPSLTKKRHHERKTLLSPREIRNLVRQYDEDDLQTRQGLVAQKEVFYIGGKKKYQIRPEYFWVLVQPVEEGEPPLTPAQMKAICPHWEYLVRSANEEDQIPERGVTLKEIATKLDALRDEVAALRDEVAATARMNKEMREDIKKLTESSRSKSEVSPLPLSSSKRRRFDSDSGDTDIVDTPTKKFGGMKLHKLID